MHLKLIFLCFASLMIFVSFENALATSEPIIVNAPGAVTVSASGADPEDRRRRLERNEVSAA